MTDPLVFPFRGGFESDDPSHIANLRTLEIWARNFKPSRQEKFNEAAGTFTNLGAGPTELNSANRFSLDLAGYVEARVIGTISIAGVTGILKAQYTLDDSTFFDLTAGFSMSSLGIKASAWTQIPAAAKTLAHVRLVGSGGNGTEDPQYRPGVSLEWR